MSRHSDSRDAATVRRRHRAPLRRHNERAFPAAAIEIGGRKGVLWRRALGSLTYEPSAGPATADTIFDLASLTKVIATTSLAMRAIDDGRLRLEDTVERWIPEWTGNDRGGVTIADLLSHSSGLTRLPAFLRRLHGPDRLQPAICGLPLEYAPRTRSIYSDLGFILLGFVLEDAQHAERRLHRRAGCGDPARRLRRAIRRLARSVTAEPLAFNPPRAGAIARRRQKWIRGGGGCWSARSTTRTRGRSAAPRVTPACSERSARWAIRARRARHDRGTPALARTETMRRFIQRAGVPGSSRALGWDTMLPTSSCGRTLVAERHRPHRIHRHVAVDRLGARPLCRAADQPRAPVARERAVARAAAAASTTRSSRPSTATSAEDVRTPGDFVQPRHARRRPIEGTAGRGVSVGVRSRRRPAQAGTWAGSGGWAGRIRPARGRRRAAATAARVGASATAAPAVGSRKRGAAAAARD